MHNYKLKGLFSWEIINSDGSVFDSEPTRNNLILTQGINAVALRSFVENMLYCAIGTGSTPPLLSDTGLTGEVQRTGDVDGAVADACITTLSSNTYSLTKTFKFPANSFPITVGQIGWSWSNTAGNNLFSKALIVKNGLPAQVTLGVGQYLRVKYTLQINISPSTAIVANSSIVNWSSPGQYNVQLIGLRSILTDGSLSYYDAGQDCNEPSSISDIFYGTSSLALGAFGSSADRSGGTNYTTTATTTYQNNGTTFKTASFGKNVGASTSIRSIGIGKAGSSPTNSGFVFLFDTNQTKGSDFIFNPKFIYTWSS